MNFDFLSPQKIVFGWGRRREIGGLARSLGSRAFLVSGSATLERSPMWAGMMDSLAKAGVAVLSLGTIRREPEVADVDAAVQQVLSEGPGPDDCVIAIGGGSAIDLGKAVSALATNSDGSSVRDYLEGVGRGLTIDRPPLPMIAVPTTAGTGSEATKNAVISSTDPPFKKSLRSERMIPRIALVDPELTCSVPPDVTAHTGMDAITQLIESFISRRAQPMPQAMALSGLTLALPSLEAVVTDGMDRAARERMAYASLLSGIALANSGLGLAHGVAAALGIQAGVPHGLACAMMLPAALRINLPVRRDDLARLARAVDPSLACDEQEAAESLIARIEALALRVGIPTRLSAVGVTSDQLPVLVRGARGNSMDGNPRDVSDEMLAELLTAML